MFSRASTASAKRSLKIVGFGNAHAVGAMAAEVGQAVAERALQAVHGLGHHLAERVLTRTLRSREDHRMRKVLARQHLAQRVDGLGIAVKIREGHSLRLMLFLIAHHARSAPPPQSRCALLSTGRRASIITTRCGSRRAIPRNASCTRAKNAWLSFSKRFSSAQPCAAALIASPRPGHAGAHIRIHEDGQVGPQIAAQSACNRNTASLPSCRPPPWYASVESVKRSHSTHCPTREPAG